MKTKPVLFNNLALGGGLFASVDDHGRLLLPDDALRITDFEPHLIRLLRGL